MENERVRTLKYLGGSTIYFIRLDVGWAVLVRNLGCAVGYQGDGQRLVSLAEHWKVIERPRDLFTPTPDHRQELEMLLTGRPFEQPAGINDPSVFTLFGVERVIRYSKVKGIRPLRTHWADIKSALQHETEMPDLSIAPPDEVVQEEKAIAERDPFTNLTKLSAFLRKQVALHIFSSEDVRGILLQATNNIGGHMAPSKAEGAESALASVDAQARGAGLAFSAPLPKKFRGWLTATDMGVRLGQHENSVEHHIPIVIEEQYGPETELRANVLAGQKIGSDPVRFQESRDPETGLATVYNEYGTCVALYAQNSAGGYSWRNYWSPQTANWLLRRLVTLYTILSNTGKV